MSFRTSLILIIFLFLVLGADLAFGFGISPPRIWNDHLTPGARFEQTVILTQAKPDRPLRIRVVMEAPDIESWLRIEPGMEFTIPEGKQQFPMKIMVDVPKDAAYETYRGELIIEALTGGEGQVVILTGAVVDFKLRVSGEEFADFKLRNVKVLNIEEGDEVKVEIELENLGNVKIRPSKVRLKIYDRFHQQLLESGEAVKMNFVEPFEKGKVTGKMPTKLGIGEYWAEIEIYKKGELILKDKRYFKVVEKGTLGLILGLPVWVWALIGGIILTGFLSFKLGLWKRILAKFGLAIKVEKIKK